MNRNRTRRRAFTLIELMVVIAIIVLLIGIGVPALRAARDNARNAATANEIGILERGCRAFEQEQGELPASRGYNPFEGAQAKIPLSGAQWLMIQLQGPDKNGYVRPTEENDFDGDHRITKKDWLDWYALQPSRKYSRFGPYVTADDKTRATPVTLSASDPDATMPAVLSTDSGTSEWNSSRIPFFIGGHSDPILYYAATVGAEEPYTTGAEGSLVVGVYDMADNAMFTGSENLLGRFPYQGNGIRGVLHPLGKLGYDPANKFQQPPPETFAEYTYDRSVFQTTQRPSGDGVVKPYNPDSFLLIAAGRDGLFGTADDVRNFRR